MLDSLSGFAAGWHIVQAGIADESALNACEEWHIVQFDIAVFLLDSTSLGWHLAHVFSKSTFQL